MLRKTTIIIVTSITLLIAQTGIPGQVDLAPSIVNIGVWTHGTIDHQAFQSGWGLPIPQQISITREDQVVPGLLHTNTWNYGFSQGYTFSQVGAQTTYEIGNDPTFGMATIRPIVHNPWPTPGPTVDPPSPK